jgi:hypothetical protein
VWLQIVHLLIADLLWIVLVLLAVEGPARREVSPQERGHLLSHDLR